MQTFETITEFETATSFAPIINVSAITHSGGFCGRQIIGPLNINKPSKKNNPDAIRAEIRKTVLRWMEGDGLLLVCIAECCDAKRTWIVGSPYILQNACPFSVFSGPTPESKD